jgi:hypothetical protein
MGTLQARFSYPKIGVLSLQGRMSGSQYDNDLNTYLLHSYFPAGCLCLARDWETL